MVLLQTEHLVCIWGKLVYSGGYGVTGCTVSGSPATTVTCPNFYGEAAGQPFYPTPDLPQGFAYQNGVLYVAYDSPEIWACSASGGTITGPCTPQNLQSQLQLIGGAWGIAFNPGGTKAFIPLGNSQGTVVACDHVGATVGRTCTLSGTSNQFPISYPHGIAVV